MELFRQLKRSVAELFRQIKRSVAELFRQIKHSVAELFRQINCSVAELFHQIKRSVAEHLEKKHVKEGGLLYGGLQTVIPLIIQGVTVYVWPSKIPKFSDSKC